MSKDYKQELKDMERLMMYGLNESKNSGSEKGILEYSQIGADGQTYGILREGTKYFIKVAPKKHTKLLAEDFDYVGGFNNKKSYDSYTKASKALNLHLISLNESEGGKKPVKSQYNLNESSEWQTKTTKEARKELNRFYELVSKVDNLLSENVHYVNEDKNAPYTDNGKASYNTNNGGGHKGDIGTQQALGIKEKGFTDHDKHDAEKKQQQYEKAKVNNKNGFGDHNVDEDGGNAYTEKAPKKMNETKKRVIKLSEEQEKQVLAWRDDRAFVHRDVDTDRSHGTEIGDTSPWTELVNEGFETEEWGSEGLPSSAGVGDAKKYPDPFDNKNGVRQPVTENFDECGMLEYGLDEDFESDKDEDVLDIIPDTDVFNPDNDFNPDGVFNPDMDSDEPQEEPYEDSVFPGEEQSEYDQYGLENLDNFSNEEDDNFVFEVTLNDFGKHPAYRKRVMTLPQNADGSEWGEDWNDESAKTELPFGRKIGDGAPFNKKVDAITDSIVRALGKKKN